MSSTRIPRDPANDHAPAAILARQEFLHEQTASKIEHVASYSLDPETLPGNVENFIGVAQVPMGGGAAAGQR